MKNQWKFWAAAVGLACAILPAQANAWWQKDWPYRKQIVIDAGPKGGNLTKPAGREPLLIRLHSGNFQFSDAMDNGADLRFVNGDDKTPLAYHIESFDPLLGVAAVWVDVPEMPIGSTKPIWLYYGGKDAKSVVDTAATFDADYAAVYHFDGDKGAPPKDKTAYGNNATSGPSSIDQGAIIGQGARFAGTAPMVVAPSASLAVKPGGPFTFSAWVKTDAPLPREAIYARRDGGSSLIIGLEQGIPFVEAHGGAPVRLAASQALAAGQWSHIAVVADGANIVLYVNGQPAAQGAGALGALNGPTAIGGDDQGAVPNLVGELDEVRISKTARPAALILADMLSQGAESKLVTFAADEKQAGIGFGLFGVIVKNVDTVSWVVIGILGALALLSWWVMWIKVTYANGIDRANDLFLEHFHRHADDPLALVAETHPDHSRFMRSSIFRVYQAGADELSRRLAQGRSTLDALEADVVRALMDSRLVRENQGLSKSMVWLTIAISGGPFLGLLGTVMGVMITFAAIAQAGDVNINAIAPGISAALLATVAGLTVAIPSLFGYNYILLRNKNISANMITFSDEFVTRISEVYSEDAQSRRKG